MAKTFRPGRPGPEHGRWAGADSPATARRRRLRGVLPRQAQRHDRAGRDPRRDLRPKRSGPRRLF